MKATVSEIHQYPPRPEDFVEPLFRTPESAAEILEHFLTSPWLARASELVRGSGRAPGGAGHAFGEDRREAVELRWRPDGKVELFQGCGPDRGLARSGKSRRRRSRKLVLYVVERWREVRGLVARRGRHRPLRLPVRSVRRIGCGRRAQLF